MPSLENSDFQSCLNKQSEIKKEFIHCHDDESRHEKIISLGKKSPKMNPTNKTKENLVHSCQSQMFLHSYFKDGFVYFESESDALISSGLAALMIKVYSGEKPETILKCPPKFLEELSIQKSLSPNRSNGLSGLFIRIKQEALKFLIAREKQKP